MSGVDYHRAFIGRCSCNNLPICAEIQTQLLNAGEEIFQGCYKIKRSDSPKITAFRKKCALYLGLAGSDVQNIRLRKHHFHLKLFQYLRTKKKLVALPISRVDAIQEGLLDYAAPYEKKNYFFVTNVSYRETESWLTTNKKSKNKKRNRITETCKESNKKSVIGDNCSEKNNSDAEFEEVDCNIENNIDGADIEL